MVDDDGERGGAGRDRRDRDPRPQHHEVLLEPSRGHRRGHQGRRLVPLGRHGQGGRGRLLLHRRPQEGADHPRRLQRLSARGRGGALRAPGVQEAAVVGVPDEALGEEVGAAVVLKKGAEVEADELKALREGTGGGLQVPAQGLVPGRAAEGPDGQDPQARDRGARRGERGRLSLSLGRLQGAKLACRSVAAGSRRGFTRRRLLEAGRRRRRRARPRRVRRGVLRAEDRPREGRAEHAADRHRLHARGLRRALQPRASRRRRNLDALAKQALAFECAVPEAMPTGPARRTLLTGMRGFPYRDWVLRRRCRSSPGWTRILPTSRCSPRCSATPASRPPT